ncbi:hypothetical protein ONE63_007923 [Megalurothrips usitatus]|uniref:Thiamine transporter 1-like n=1 Tax=Megalurothrips usitatus TaxID=439358 RepID=A0AAV7XSQ6_9NEOP|nr:hypothetical protein ONE63_007923 [Megalurothrips usitatus]
MALAWRILVPLCAFGFLKEFRPSESFVTKYLVGPDKNFTKDEVNQDIYPVATYSNLSLLILVFLLTDWARYKPVIILEGVSGAITYCLIIWGHDLPTIQAAEFFYGLFMATEVAYLTYMYAVSEKKDFQKVSGCLRSGILLGRFVSGVICQLTISFNILTYHQLNYLTLAGVSISALVASSLPSVKKSMYFHSKTAKQPESNTVCEASALSLANEDHELNAQPDGCFVENQNNQESDYIVSSRNKAMRMLFDALKAMSHDFLFAYRNIQVLKWSLWWALATCGYLQVTSYIQSLWHVTAEKDEQLYNGLVDAVYTLIGSLSTWFVGQYKINFAQCTGLILTICCLLQGTFLLLSAGSVYLWGQYILYILFKILHHSTMVLASSEVAKSLHAESHALIFGFNMFMALCLQSVFTLTVAAKGGLELTIRNQFFVYGGYFIVLGIGFVISMCLPAAFNLLKSNGIGNKGSSIKDVRVFCGKSTPLPFYVRPCPDLRPNPPL